MAIIDIGLRSATKSKGNSAAGNQVYLVVSDAQVLPNSIDSVLDASVDSSRFIPAYFAAWGGDDTNNLRVSQKRFKYNDEFEGCAEGYVFDVIVDYEPPSFQPGQEAEDPADRDWIWSIGFDKREIVTASSTYDTSGYVYPGSVAGNMVNLGANKAITNTAGEPPQDGVMRTVSRPVVTLRKYVAAPTDLGLSSSYSELADYVDTINSAAVTILGFSVAKWEGLMDQVTWEPITENGYERVMVTFTIVLDKQFTHVFTFPSSGYNQVVDGSFARIKNADGQDAANPRLLDATGGVIALPGSSPYTLDPYYVSTGVHITKSWASLSLPSAIP